jgi:hypothetical protein
MELESFAKDIVCKFHLNKMREEHLYLLLQKCIARLLYRRCEIDVSSSTGISETADEIFDKMIFQRIKSFTSADKEICYIYGLVSRAIGRRLRFLLRQALAKNGNNKNGKKGR